jgi:heme-degrading monooxygenase HmoA
VINSFARPCKAGLISHRRKLPKKKQHPAPGVNAGEGGMILEVAIMKIKPDRIAEFEAVFPKAAAVSASTPGYISHELQRCVETPGKYFYMIRWETMDAHLVNFRQSPRREQFRNLLADFWAEPNFTEHFEPVTDSRL